MRADRSDRRGSGGDAGLPPVAPATGWCSALRLPRGHYIRLEGNDYSVHRAAVGRRVLVRADLDRVQAFCDGQSVAEHTQTGGSPTHPQSSPLSSNGGVEEPQFEFHRLVIQDGQAVMITSVAVQ